MARAACPRAEKEQARLKRRFRAVSRRYERAIRLRRIWRWARVAVPIAGVAAVLALGLLSLSPWPPMTTLRHIAAFPNCNAARAVGLAPAYRGGPGYWQRHDRDRDGIACEPWPHRPSTPRPWLPRPVLPW